MTPESWYVLGVLVVSLGLLLSEKVSMDVVGVGIIVALCMRGILAPARAVAGFANPAVVTIGALFVVGEALIRTGAVGWVADRLIRFVGSSENRLFLSSTVIVAVISGFINNTPVVVLFVPILISLGRASGISPSKVLIPVSFASILGGTCTLIGTSTNLAIQGWLTEYGAEKGLEPFGMFEFAPLGAILTAVGLLYLHIVARRILPDRQPGTLTLGDAATEYLTELRVSPGSRWIGRTAPEAMSERPGIRLLQLIRGEEMFWAPLDDVTLEEGDLLLVKGNVVDVVDLKQSGRAAPSPGDDSSSKTDLKSRPRELSLAELVVTPNSALVGRTLADVRFHDETGLVAIAVQRHGAHLREKISQLRLAVGDMLLVQGEVDRIESVRGSRDYLLLEGVADLAINRRAAPIATLIFAAIVVLASLRLSPSLDILVLSLAGVCLLVALGAVSSRQAYRAIHWPVLFLIGGMISLAAAMQKTGLDVFIADSVASALVPFGRVWVLAGVLTVTSLLSQFINKTAVALLMVGLAVNIATKLGADPMPFVMAVVFGATACFGTPFGYQTNAFVYGPGGYRFLDYVRVGLPLNAIVIVVSSLLIPVFWPL